MGPPLGNKNAKGNSGGRPYSKANRKKAAKLKGLCLSWAIKVMKKQPITRMDYSQQQLVLQKILPTCIPRPIEMPEDDGGNSLVVGLLKLDLSKTTYEELRRAEQKKALD